MWFPKLSLVLIILSFTLFSLFLTPTFAIKKSFIVYLGSHAHGPEPSEADLVRATDFHHAFLGSFLGSADNARDSIIYSYNNHINGFAAMLEEEEAAEIAKHPSVVSVFLNQAKKLHTTRSWDFMLLESNGVIHSKSAWSKARFGEDTIIANLDTGVWPESKSFSDEGFGPIPSKWKGICQNNTKAGVPCKRKLIGATYFNKAYVAAVRSMDPSLKIDPSLNSARDHEGHGTHTLSTAGGNFVPGANVLGLGNGIAKGGSPKARVAAYKVCWPPVKGSGECYDGDIMKGFDSAIHDGIDVLSVSLGGDPLDYVTDSIAIGAFHAVRKGIVAVCSAGNSGPGYGTVSNIAPWMITVAASTLDREFQAFVELQNGKLFKGTGLSKPLNENKFYPLITGEQAVAAGAYSDDANLCMKQSLDPEKVKGKIVACLRGVNARVEKGQNVAAAGGVGMILCNDPQSGNELTADPHVLPAAQVTYTDGQAVMNYISSSNIPVGFITPSKAQLHTSPAPFMASFSSRGPNSVTSDIIKPDVTAPGVNIIAAYTEATGPTGIPNDTRRFAFNIESGTSMSCPHVSGLAGLLKTLHPEWSPAAIKSAIMTTARTRDNTNHSMHDGDNEEATPLDYGSGHIRPNRAVDPGLVYDLSADDYLYFLCATGYDQKKIKHFTGSPYKCPESASLLDFNYPSMAVTQLPSSITLTRKLKNVGSPGKYRAHVREPYGVSVSVEPNTLTFENAGEEKSFKMTLKPKWAGAAKKYEFGWLTWTDGKHYVRSPIAVIDGGFSNLDDLSGKATFNNRIP